MVLIVKLIQMQNQAHQEILRTKRKKNTADKDKILSRPNGYTINFKIKKYGSWMDSVKLKKTMLKNKLKNPYPHKNKGIWCCSS